MDIRIRCSCGKPLTIAAGDVGKRLNCPECGKAFRISPDKLAACAMKKKTAAPASFAPPVATPAPRTPAMPAALGDQPADLDPDILTLISDGEPLTTQSGVPTSSAPSVVLVDEAVELAYARASSKARTHGESDAIQEARHSFWLDVTLAIVYPVQSVGNALTFGGLCLVALMHLVIQEAPFGGILMGPMMLMGWFALYGWFCAYYMSIVIDTSAGSSSLPGIRIDGGWWEDVLKPGLLFILAQLIIMVPTAMIWWFTKSPWATLGGAGVMLFFYPFIILLFSLSDASALARLDLVALTMFRTLPAYLLIFILLTLATTIDYAVPAARMLNARGIINLPKGHFLLAKNLGFLALRHLMAFYATTVCMRLIGLYYLHFKHKFAFEFE